MTVNTNNRHAQILRTPPSVFIVSQEVIQLVRESKES